MMISKMLKKMSCIERTKDLQKDSTYSSKHADISKIVTLVLWYTVQTMSRVSDIYFDFVILPKFLMAADKEFFHKTYVTQESRARAYKIFSMLNSAEHEILNAHKFKNIKKFSF